MDSSSELFARSDRETAVDELHAATAIYTCEPVVDALLDHVPWPLAGRSLVDTSCGDGAFLRRALARLLSQQPGLTDAELLSRICGWEIHPFAADQARRELALVLGSHGYDSCRAARVADAMVRCGDFLTEGPKTPSFDAVVGNPPYLRMTNVPLLLRNEYETELPGYAQADLLHGFLDRCARVLRPDGVLAMVTSDRWFLNSGAAGLREAIGRVFRLAHLERIDVTSAFYRPKQRRAGSPPRVHPCAVVLKASEGSPIGREPIFPGATALTHPATSRTLGDVCELRLAPWLGTPGIFLLDAETACTLPAEHLVPAVDTDDIRQGKLLQPTRRAIRTSPGETPPQAVLDHLARSMPSMCARGLRSRCPWLPPEPFYGWDLTQPSLLVPRIAKSLRPVLIPAGVLPVNHNISVVRAGQHTLEEIAGHLSSDRAAEWIHVAAARLENGYRSITTRLLRQLPID